MTERANRKAAGLPGDDSSGRGASRIHSKGEAPRFPALLDTMGPIPPEHFSFLHHGAHWDLELVGPHRWLLSRRGLHVVVLKPTREGWKGCSLDESLAASTVAETWPDVVAEYLIVVTPSALRQARSRSALDPLRRS